MLLLRKVFFIFSLLFSSYSYFFFVCSREKLVLDMLAASGAATLSGSWTRVFINGEGYGLFLLMDDISTHLIDNILHGGDWKSKNTGKKKVTPFLLL